MIAVGLLTAAHVFFVILRVGLDHDTTVYGLARLFLTSREQAIPAWYSSLSLFLCAVLLWINGRAEEERWLAWHWYFLMLLFVFVSMDEALAIHERLNGPVRAALGTGGLFYWAWIIPYGAAAILIALAYIPFFKALPAHTRLFFILSAVVFLSGAIGMEMLAAAESERSGGTRNLAVELYSGVEETLEMLGVVGFMYALADHLARKSVELKFAV